MLCKITHDPILPSSRHLEYKDDLINSLHKVATHHSGLWSNFWLLVEEISIVLVFSWQVNQHEWQGCVVGLGWRVRQHCHSRLTLNHMTC